MVAKCNSAKPHEVTLETQAAQREILSYNNDLDNGLNGGIQAAKELLIIYFFVKLSKIRRNWALVWKH